MDDESTGASGAGAEPVLEIPTWGSDTLDALIGDDYTPQGDETPTEGEPAGDEPAPEPDADPADPTETTATDDGSEDDADDPDELKEILKGLSRSQKGKVRAHYASQAEERVRAAQEIERKNQEDASAREATAREIREKRGRFIGEVEGKRDDGKPIPTFSELERLLLAPRGYETLAHTYGLSEDDARAQHAEWRDRREMLDGSLEDFRTDAWMESGKLLAASVAKSGLPLDEVWKGVTSVSDVVPKVVAHLQAQHSAELAKQKNEYESRLRAATSNKTATAARSVAKSHPTPEVGGRTDGSGARVYTTSEISDLAFYKAHEADIDRAYDEGRIVHG